MSLSAHNSDFTLRLPGDLRCGDLISMKGWTDANSPMFKKLVMVICVEPDERSYIEGCCFIHCLALNGELASISVYIDEAVRVLNV